MLGNMQQYPISGSSRTYNYHLFVKTPPNHYFYNSLFLLFTCIPTHVWIFCWIFTHRIFTFCCRSVILFWFFLSVSYHSSTPNVIKVFFHLWTSFLVPSFNQLISPSWSFSAIMIPHISVFLTPHIELLKNDIKVPTDLQIRISGGISPGHR